MHVTRVMTLVLLLSTFETNTTSLFFKNFLLYSWQQQWDSPLIFCRIEIQSKLISFSISLKIVQTLIILEALCWTLRHLFLPVSIYWRNQSWTGYTRCDLNDIPQRAIIISLYLLAGSLMIKQSMLLQVQTAISSSTVRIHLHPLWQSCFPDRCLLGCTVTWTDLSLSVRLGIWSWMTSWISHLPISVAFVIALKGRSVLLCADQAIHFGVLCTLIGCVPSWGPSVV